MGATSSSNWDPVSCTLGKPFLLTESTDGTFTIRYAENGYSITAWSTGIGVSTGSGTYFNLTATEGGYLISRKDATDQYLGSTDGSTSIVPNLTEGNIVWQFLTEEAGARYCAELRLYNALVAMDTYAGLPLDEYEEAYADRASLSPEELDAKAASLEKVYTLYATYTFPSWADVPILLEPTQGTWETYKGTNSYYRHGNASSGDHTLKGTFVADTDATLSYSINTSKAHSLLEVLIDGKVVRTYSSTSQLGWNKTVYDEVPAGRHEVEWRFTGYIGNGNGDIYSIGVASTPLISVSLLEPGSLGTEVLYNVNSVKDVRRLKVAGKMNDADWAIINMMENLYSLDLSEASYPEIKASQFNEGTPSGKVHAVKLPYDLQTIGNRAFAYSSIEEIEIPATVTTIDNEAFMYTCLKEITLPEALTSLGTSAIRYNYFLEKAYLPNSLKTISNYAFNSCNQLREIHLPEQLETVGMHAFSGCNNMQYTLPSTVKSLAEGAFAENNVIESLILPEGITFTGSWVFSNCKNLKYVEMPVSLNNLTATSTFSGCTGIRTLVLKSPTVVTGQTAKFLEGCNVSNVTLRVPSFLVNSYKLDDVWYNYGNIEGFSTAEIKDWTINADLVLNARDRFEGQPNITLDGAGSLKVNGEAPMAIQNFLTNHNVTNNDVTRMLSNCENISIAGTHTRRFYIPGGSWYFLSLPFNAKVSDVTSNNGALYAIRYYDGADRAASASTASNKNWKNYAADDIIPAGTGFIVQTNKATLLKFLSQEDESKQYAVSYTEFAKALQENPSESSQHKGWNLVGNPYLTYYNIHYLNFTAPITLWTGSTYAAYSVIDDDVAIQPCQAFFVQCPEEVSSISFPLEGRQLTSVIESQNGTSPKTPRAGHLDRQLIDLQLVQGDFTDRTRVVLNDAAALDYETQCDAAKFMSDDASVPQIYTLDADGTQYAINERPEADGTVRLGFYAGKGGAFTLTLSRNLADAVCLVDHATGTTHDLTAGDYHFTAEAGTDDTRFALLLKAYVPTGIETAGSQENAAEAADGGIYVRSASEIYTAGGRLVAKAQGAGLVSLPQGVYVVKAQGRAVKISVNR